MRKGIVDINNKYTKIMLLAILIIASILSVYLVTNTNKKAFNANIINQKASNAVREVVNIPDQDLKNFLLTNFKNANGRRIGLTEGNYVKPSDENEIYKDEMEKITSINAYGINTKQTPLDLTGLETAVNIQEQLNLDYNKIENLEPLRGLTNLIELSLKGNKIENIEPLKGLVSLKRLYFDNNKIENAEPLKGLTNLLELALAGNKIENIEPLKGLINLTSLKLRKNKIENIEPLKGLTNLTNLELQENKIENIDALKQLINLKILIIHTNKIKNIEPVRGLINLTYLYIAVNKIENVDAVRGLINLRTLRISTNKIENLEPIKELTNLPELYVDTEEINTSPNTNKFNLPVLKKYNGEILDIVQASNGLLKKNTDGTYSFTRKVTGVQTVNVGKGIANKDPKVDANWNTGYPIYILKIDPTNIADEKVSITKAVKDMSNTLLNNDKETKVLPVIKRNGQVITNVNTNNVGHRANNDELLTYTWNELPKADDTGVDYNYEVTFDISGLPEGYSINPNTKTTDNQADFNITYVSPKITVTKDIAVNGGDKANIPNEITVTISNDKGLPEKEVTATLKPDNSGYVVSENLDKTTNTGENITYTVVPKTDIPNYTKNDNGYTYVSPKAPVTKDIAVNGGDKTKLPNEITVTISNDKGLPEKEVTATLKPDKSGYVVNENLDKTNLRGENVTYTVVPKTDLPNYTKTSDAYTYISPKVNVTVEKNWVNGETVRPETITAKLKRKITSDNTYTFVQNVTVRKDNNWQLVVANLDKTDANGNDYTYIVEEETNVANFTPSYSGLIVTNT
ncbi:MAG: leucine-rich repeat domain-containing protein, partial [Clostridiales bacterium]|nr:leucine-rich repeat domain-containing protein [Clostridiales bacterium]